MSDGVERIENEIKNLADQLESLCIQQSQVATKLKRLRGKLAQERRRSQESGVGSPSSTSGTSSESGYYYFENYRFRNITGKPYTNVFKPDVDHIVRIKNPGRDQKRVGRIIGFCKDGKAKINTHQQRSVIRATKNLVYIDSGEIFS